MSKEITLLPDYIDIIQEPSVEFYKTATNLMDVFSTYTGELSVAAAIPPGVPNATSFGPGPSIVQVYPSCA